MGVWNLHVEPDMLAPGNWQVRIDGDGATRQVREECITMLLADSRFTQAVDAGYGAIAVTFRNPTPTTGSSSWVNELEDELSASLRERLRG